jgi:hypothetical protein
MLEYKHKFIYRVSKSDVEGVPKHSVSMTLEGEISLNDMLEKFQQYLLAVGYLPPENTMLDFVPRE